MVRPCWGSTRVHPGDPAARLSQDEHHRRHRRGRRNIAAGGIQATAGKLRGRLVSRPSVRGRERRHVNMRTGHAMCTAGRQWYKACALCAAMPLLVTLGLTAVGAQTEGQRAIFDLTVNQQPKGEVFVYLEGPDVYARVSDLRGAGLGSLDSGHTIKVQGDEFVLLASLAPNITYQVDETTFVLQLTARSALLGTTTLNLGFGRPAGMTYSD